MLRFCLRPSKRGAGPRYRPGLEPLEERCLPSLTAFLVHTLGNPTPADEELAGRAVAPLGTDKVLVGAQDANNAVGEVYLFDTSGTLLRTFQHPNPGGHTQGSALAFGVSMAAVGNGNVVIGAEGADTAAADAGEAYLFDASNGNLLQTYLNPLPNDGDAFGSRMAALGTDKVIIAADLDDPGGVLDAGSVYLFDAASGNLLRTFNSPAPAASDQFGLGVAAVGTDKILIGAPGGQLSLFFDTQTYQIDSVGPGIAYLFDATTGALLQTFTNPTPAVDDLFGWQVAAVGTTQVLIGAPGDDTGGNDAGAAYLFDIATGNVVQTYTGKPQTLLGAAVSAAGNNRLLIGAPLEKAADNVTVAGAVYMVDRTANATLKIKAPKAQGFLAFGDSVAALSPSHIIVGAPGDNLGANAAGAAYYYDVPPAVPVITTMAAGDRQLFGLDDEGRLWRFRAGDWTASGGWGISLAVGNTGDSDSTNDIVYLRTSDSRLWTWSQTSWAYTGGFVPSVVPGDNQAFSIGFDGQLWRYRVGAGWLAARGWGAQIDVGNDGDADANDDIVFLRGVDSRIWTWNQLSWAFTGGWLPPGFHAGDGQLFGLGSDGKLWRYRPAMGWTYSGGYGVDFTLANLGDGDPNNDFVFLHSADNRIWTWNQTFWVYTGGYLASILGGDNQVFGRGLDGQRWRYRLSGPGAGWTPNGPTETVLKVGGDGDANALNDILFQLAADGSVALWDQAF